MKPPIRFAISLRLRHPCWEPGDISENLQLLPRHSWKAGDDRQTPSGKVIGGRRDETYWTSVLKEGSSATLAEEVENWTGRLKGKSEFLDRFTSTGGSIEFFVGWFPSEISGGESFDWELLKRLAELRIALTFDIYSSPQDTPD